MSKISTWQLKADAQKVKVYITEWKPHVLNKILVLQPLKMAAFPIFYE